jgi:putative nucleotidyltransferase with HDIG domain
MFKNQCGRQGLIYVSEACTLDLAQKRLLDMFCSNICIAYSNVSLYEELEHTQQEAISMLGTVAEFRSSETANHVVRVAKYAGLLARKLGLPDEEAERIELAAPLHDIGKIGIPDRILMKPGRLTGEEYTIMQRHAEIGYHMLADSKRPLLQAAAEIAHQHQEKWDGSGYPRQLAGEDIHLYGRIVALADVFDALLSRRCYKESWDIQDVIGYIKEQRARHFDPTLANLLLDNIDEFCVIANNYQDNEQTATATLQ